MGSSYRGHLSPIQYPGSCHLRYRAATRPYKKTPRYERETETRRCKRLPPRVRIPEMTLSCVDCPAPLVPLLRRRCGPPQESTPARRIGRWHVGFRVASLPRPRPEPPSHSVYIHGRVAHYMAFGHLQRWYSELRSTEYGKRLVAVWRIRIDESSWRSSGAPHGQPIHRRGGRDGGHTSRFDT